MLYGQVRTVKNRYRATMLDGWFSSILILVWEKDVMHEISGADIVDKFARYSLPLRKQLMSMLNKSNKYPTVRLDPVRSLVLNLK
jgi:hypothetical protein